MSLSGKKPGNRGVDSFLNPGGMAVVWGAYSASLVWIGLTDLPNPSSYTSAYKKRLNFGFLDSCLKETCLRSVSDTVSKWAGWALAHPEFIFFKFLFFNN